MTGSETNKDNPHSPRTRGIIQHFELQVKLHTEGLNDDLQVTNDKLGHLEQTQIATNTKLTSLETSVKVINTSLAALLRHFDALSSLSKQPAGTKNFVGHEVLLWRMSTLLILNWMTKKLVFADVCIAIP